MRSLGPVAWVLFVSLVLERTVITGLDQFRGSGVEDVAGGVVDLGCEIVELVTTPGGVTLLDFEALEFVDLVQQPPGRGVEFVVCRAHEPKYWCRA